MTRKSIGSLSGLGLLLIVACTGGGGPNDFGAPVGDAPLDPAAPPDPNAPPASTTEPPFGGVAPQPPNQPPSDDCTSLCNEIGQACGANPAVELAACVSDCKDIQARCFAQTSAWIRCLIANGCTDETDACDARLRQLRECIDPEPPGGGEGGQGGN